MQHIIDAIQKSRIDFGQQVLSTFMQCGKDAAEALLKMPDDIRPTQAPEVDTCPAVEVKPARKGKASKAVPRRAMGKLAVQAARDLKPNQKVIYRQGRGAFNAYITSVNYSTGIVGLERLKDKKHLTRPANAVTTVALAA